MLDYYILNGCNEYGLLWIFKGSRSLGTLVLVLLNFLVSPGGEEKE